MEPLKREQALASTETPALNWDIFVTPGIPIVTPDRPPGIQETFFQANRRFGKKSKYPLLCLQHFTGTLDNWDPAVTDPLAAEYDVILFESPGIGRSTGKVPSTMAEMAQHVFAFLQTLGIDNCDVLGYSLGGMIAQQMALDSPKAIHKMVLVGTAPRGGEDIMHLNKPSIDKHVKDPTLKGYQVLQKIFFAPTDTSQASGQEFIRRLTQRQQDREPPAGPEVAQAQMAAFGEWEKYTGERFADLKRIQQPTLVVNGVHDEMIPVLNSYWLGENLPNAVLLTYPDAGHGSLFQWHESFTRQVKEFLASDSAYAPY
jgi:pimeloyl-ACP methyl ester carboxylesterase